MSKQTNPVVKGGFDSNNLLFPAVGSDYLARHGRSGR